MKTTKCSVCNTDFPSRNKLFQHLESSGHGSRESSVVKDTSQIDGDDDNSKQPQLSKGNDAYYEYYRRQKICNEDNDDKVWKEAYYKLRTPLPITYRIHESNPLSTFSVDLLSLMDKNEGDGNESQLTDWSFANNESMVKEDDNIPKLRMTITSNVHRSNKRSKDDVDKDKFSSVLHALQELGSIHRQELVSAIPPLVLWSAGSSSGESGPIVADMCAA